MTEEETFATPDEESAPTGWLGTRGESSRQRSARSDDNGQVVTDALTPSQAFEVFAGRSYYSKLGSSGSAGNSGIGVLGQNSVSAVAGRVVRSPPADPVSRYFRLRAELDDLEADLQALSPSSSSPSSAMGTPASEGGGPEAGDDKGESQHQHRPNEVFRVMREELTSMRGRLAKAGDSAALKPLLDGAMDQQPGAGGVEGAPGSARGGSGSSRSTTTSALYAAIAEFQQQQQPPREGSQRPSGGYPPRGPDGGSSGEGGATFELFVANGAGSCGGGEGTRGGSSKGGGGGQGESSSGDEDGESGKVARLQSLEQRLHRLEQAVGKRPLESASTALGAGGLRGAAAGANASKISAPSGGASVVEALRRLEQRVGRLEPQTVAQARKEIAPLQKTLEQILLAEQKRQASSSSSSNGGGGGGTGTSEAAQLQALYKRTMSIDDFGPDLPALVGRLRSLQSLHENAARWLNRLHEVEQRQASITSALSVDRAALSALEKGLQANLEAVAGNIAEVDRRISAAASPAAPPPPAAGSAANPRPPPPPPPPPPKNLR